MAKLTKVQIALLGSIVAATAEGSFLHTSTKDHGALLKQGLVEVNTEIANEAGEYATRATAEGIQAHDELSKEGETVEPTVKPTFTIAANVEIPANTRRRRNAEEQYPFSQLEIGQSFFVPNSDDKPDAFKSLGSTIHSANRRYSEVVEGQFTTNAKGEQVAATRQLRKFVTARVADGAAWGHAGVEGAGVWRVELDA